MKAQLDIRPHAAKDTLVGHWLAYLALNRERTLEATEGLADEQLETASEEQPNSIGTLLYHIAAIEMDWLFVEVLDGDIPEEVVTHFPFEVRTETGQLTPVTGWSLEDYTGLLERTRLIFESHLKVLSSAEFRRVRDLPEYTVTPEWVCWHLLEHEAAHRGQIQTLRSRLIGA